MRDGLIFGFTFLAVLILVLIVKRKMIGGNGKCQFDERQMVIRGEAYKYGFWALLICILIDAMLRMCQITWCQEPFAQFAAVFVAVIVFGVKLINEDSFFGMHQNVQKIKRLYYLVIVFQLIGTIGAIKDGELIVDGKLSIQCISPLCAITFLIMLILTWRREQQQKNAEEEEE